MAMTAGIFLGPLLGGVVYDSGGYYAVYAMAFALIGVDLVLRLCMIEKRVALDYITAADTPGHATELQNVVPEDEECKDLSNQRRSVDDQVSVKQPRFPPIIWLLGSNRILVALLAAVVFGTIQTSFDSVCLQSGNCHLVAYTLTSPTLSSLGTSSLCGPNVWLVINWRWSHFPYYLRAFPL